MIGEVVYCGHCQEDMIISDGRNECPICEEWIVGNKEKKVDLYYNENKRLVTYGYVPLTDRIKEVYRL